MKNFVLALLLSSSQGVLLEKSNNQQMLQELMSEGSTGHHHHHHHHHHMPTVTKIFEKKFEANLKKKGADHKGMIESKEEKILSFGQDDLSPKGTHEALNKYHSGCKKLQLMDPKVVQVVDGPFASAIASEAVPIEDSSTPEKKIDDGKRPESRTDIDNRSVIQKAHDRAEEKLTFSDWKDNQNKKELGEYLKNPAKNSALDDADEIADEKKEQKEKQKDADIKLQKKILKKTDKAIDKAEKQDLKKQKKDLFEQARDAPNEKERKIIIDQAAKMLETKAQTVKEAEEKGKVKIEQAIAATSFGEAATKPVPEAPEAAPVSTAQISSDNRISADEFVYSDYMW